MVTRLIIGIATIEMMFASTSFADTTLRMKFKPGETQKMKMTQKQSTSSRVPGQAAVKGESTTVMFMETVCDEVDSEGGATQRSRLTRSTMLIELPMPLNKTLKYDTNDPAPTEPFLAPIDNILRPMIGEDMKMKMDSKGTIKDFSIPEKALSGMKGSPLGAMGGDMFSEAGMKQMTEQSGLSVPEAPLKVGDKWTVPFEMKSPIGKLKMSRVHTYLGPDGKPGLGPDVKLGYEKIGITISMELEPDPNSKLPVKAKLTSSDGDGEFLFDNKLGRLFRSQINTHMEMELSLGAQSIVQSIDGEVTVETSYGDE